MAAPAPAWQYPNPAPPWFPTQLQLNLFTFQQTMQNIEANPQLTVLFFQWGLRSGGFWQGHPQLLNEQDILNWHQVIAGGAPLATPLPNLTVDANYNAHHWPIDYLVRRGNIACLQELQAAGYWHPLGFTAKGESYLHLAREADEIPLSEFILSAADRDHAFATSHPCPPLVTGNPNPTTTHFDYLFSKGDYVATRDWWRSIDRQARRGNGPPLGTAHLNLASLRYLCRTANRTFAQQLLTNNGVDLSTTNMGHVQGTRWHDAVHNSNSNFIDFLSAQNATPNIDLFGGHFMTPLVFAETNNKESHYERLLNAGADADADFLSKVGTLPVVSKDKWVRKLARHVRNNNPNPGLQTAAVLYLHEVINRLNTEVVNINNNNALTAAQKRYQRRKYVKRTIHLIRLIRAGSIHGQPHIMTRDMTPPTGFTARQLAQSFGLHELLNDLD
ncbi:hypothetical protein BDV12DRAFT_201633 [Aspergillus spectabilis]